MKVPSRSFPWRVSRRGMSRTAMSTLEDGDVHAFFPGEDAPLFEDLPVVPPEAVDAFHAEEVVFFHAPHERPVAGPVEIAAGLFVRVDARSGDAPRPEGDALSVFVLFPGADPDVAVGIHMLSFLLKAVSFIFHFQQALRTMEISVSIFYRARRIGLCGRSGK